MQSYTVKLADGSDYNVGQLFTKGIGNVKLNKSEKANLGYMTIGLHLAPANLSGHEVCASRSPGCTQACLNGAGMGQVHKVQKGRIAKTRLFFQQRDNFMTMLHTELVMYRKRAHKQGKILAVRLNVLSDIMWEKLFPNLFEEFADVQFYDYTKHIKRAAAFDLSRVHKDAGFFPLNYHITFSRSEVNQKDFSQVVTYKYTNVAVVFENNNYPPTYAGREVVNGDETDLRFLDKPGVIVGLYAKGIKGRQDDSGFVIPTLGLIQRKALV